MSQHQAGSDSFERLMMRFYEHQADLLRVHEQYLHDQQEMCYRFLQLMQQHYAGRQVEEPNLLMAEAVSKPFPNDSLAKPNQQASAISTAIPATLSVDLPIASQPVVPAISSQSPMYESTKIADLVDGNGGLHPETQTTAPPNLADSQNAIAQIQPTPAPGTVDVTTLAHSLLEVVSDKTGYPVEMLEIEMDMEAELGIDSIKRVEILGAMQELFPDLPPVNSEALAELRTLQQVVDYMGQQAIVMKKKTAALA